MNTFRRVSSYIYHKYPNKPSLITNTINKYTNKSGYFRKFALGFSMMTAICLLCKESAKIKFQAKEEYIDERQYELQTEPYKPTKEEEEEDKMKDIRYQSTNKFRNMVLISGTANKDLSREIAMHLKSKLCRLSIKKNFDGEFLIDIHDSVRGKSAYIVQPTCAPVNENLMELLLLVSCLKRSSVSKITVVMPYYGYSRFIQKEYEDHHIPVVASDVATMLYAMGVSRVITVDLHASDTRGFFPTQVPVTNVDPAPLGVNFFKEKIDNKQMRDKLVVVSTDTNGIIRALRFKNLLSLAGYDAGVAFIADKRERSGYTYRAEYNSNFDTNGEVVGDTVVGKDCVIIDDIIDTGRRAIRTAELLEGLGAKSIFMYATHGVFSNPDFYEKLESSPIQELVITNTIPNDNSSNKIQQISVSELLAEAIKRSHLDKNTEILEISI